MMNALNQHFFLALPLPDFMCTYLERQALQLQSEFPFKQWVRPSDYHITLVFLGAGGFKQINRLKQELGRVVRRHSATQITIDKLGTFGKRQQPRVLWAGISVDETMYNLQQELHQTCSDLGFELDQRPYKPHITLAKKWAGQDELDSARLENAIHFDDKRNSWVAKEVALYQTHPRQIPQYQVLKLFSLRQ